MIAGKQLYDAICNECSKHVTKRYSTSFSAGISVFAKKYRQPIYSIYGFVRFADEIVDTFHEFDKKQLLDDFKLETFKAIDAGISLNPILQSFQQVVNQYDIRHEYIHAFLQSMEMDLYNDSYNRRNYTEYIYGSAEVVGLMCLKVFVDGDQERFDHLKASARSLGAAFQKVNFLRDMGSDYLERGRVYFPKVDFNDFGCDQKKQIEAEIKQDFDDAFVGIKQLPDGVRAGVYLAYVYYLHLFNRIRNSTASKVRQERIRVPDYKKLMLLTSSSIRIKLGLL